MSARLSRLKSLNQGDPSVHRLWPAQVPSDVHGLTQSARPVGTSSQLPDLSPECRPVQACPAALFDPQLILRSRDTTSPTEETAGPYAPSYRTYPERAPSLVEPLLRVIVDTQLDKEIESIRSSGSNRRWRSARVRRFCVDGTLLVFCLRASCALILGESATHPFDHTMKRFAHSRILFLRLPSDQSINTGDS